MLGKQIGEIIGKATGQRVLDADELAMETSVAAREILQDLKLM
jgi:hypothetical protein